MGGGTHPHRKAIILNPTKCPVAVADKSEGVDTEAFNDEGNLPS